jgi:hypothetical protein
MRNSTAAAFNVLIYVQLRDSLPFTTYNGDIRRCVLLSSHVNSRILPPIDADAVGHQLHIAWVGIEWYLVCVDYISEKLRICGWFSLAAGRR